MPNLLVNGDFSDGLNGWGGSDGGQTREVVDGVLHIVSDGTSVSVTQNILEVGLLYHITADVTVASGSGKIQLGSGGWYQAFSSSGSLDYIAENEGDDGSFYVARQGAGDFTIDNIVVELANQNNLVVNGYFGDGADGLDGWYVYASDQTIEVVAGAVHFVTDGEDFIRISQNILQVGATYHVKADSTVASGEGKIQMGSSGHVHVIDSTGPIEYVAVNTGVDGEFFVARQAGSAGDFTIDNIVVELVAPGNVITNGYFIDGLDGWTVNNSLGQTVEVVNGVLHIVSDGSWCSVNQSVLEEGATYHITADAVVTSGAGGKFEFSGGFHDISSTGPVDFIAENVGSTTLTIARRSGGGDFTVDNVVAIKISTDAQASIGPSISSCIGSSIS